MQKKVNVRTLAMTAVLGAVATVLMFFSFSIPIILPSFLAMDFSELPALIAAFTMGPVSGVVVCLIKNLVNLPSSGTGGAGELCNFLMGVTFVVPAGLIYKFRKDRVGAVLGSLVGAVYRGVSLMQHNPLFIWAIDISGAQHGLPSRLHASGRRKEIIPAIPLIKFRPFQGRICLRAVIYQPRL